MYKNKEADKKRPENIDYQPDQNSQIFVPFGYSHFDKGSGDMISVKNNTGQGIEKRHAKGKRKRIVQELLLGSFLIHLDLKIKIRNRPWL